jgi:hypothetical protein
MILTIRSWFNEPGIEFEVSYKVHNFIRQTIIDDIMIPFGLIDKDPSTYIGLVITTNPQIADIEVRGPEYDKRNKFINYGVWLPYKRICEAENYLNEYIECLFSALILLFKMYGIPSSAVTIVKNKVEEEVLNNDKYKYSE